MKVQPSWALLYIVIHGHMSVARHNSSYKISFTTFSEFVFITQTNARPTPCPD